MEHLPVVSDDDLMVQYQTVLRHNAVESDASEPFAAPSTRSALFRRLKHGLQPLVFPPPRRFYKPAYDLIEGKGFHPVTSVDIANDTHTVYVDQCEFSLLDASDAAKRLMELTRSITQRCQCSGPCPRLLSTQCSPIWPDVIRAYRQDPEFIVRHQNWPAFRITMGRTVRTVAFDRVDAVLKQGFALAKDASPLTLPVFLLDPVVRGIVRSDSLDSKKLEFEQLTEAASSPDPFRRAIASAQMTLTPSLDAYLQPYRNDPRLLDWLAVECAGWQISKDDADWNSFPIYLDPDSSLT